MTEEVDNTLRLNSYVILICGQFVRRPLATWFCGADDNRHNRAASSFERAGTKRSTTKMREVTKPVYLYPRRRVAAVRWSGPVQSDVRNKIGPFQDRTGV